jgi:signal transduction histidine kinase/ActR/RegA family two-component response regulator
MASEERLHDDVTWLVDAAQRLCVARDLNAVIDVVRHAARRLANADGATFVLSEGDHVYYAGEDSKAPLWQGRRFKATECISGWSIAHRERVVIEDIYADPRVPVDAYRPTYVKSLAMVPVNRQAPIAAIGVYWEKQRVPSERELEMLQALADATATAVANTELYRGLVAAREELEHTTTRLRLALDAAAIGTWDWNLRTDELSWDDRTKAMFALPRDTAIDFPLFVSRVHPEDRARTQAAIDAALDGDNVASAGHYDIEYRILPIAAAGERWIAARGRALFDGERQPIRFVGTVRDITQQKSAEAEKAELLRHAHAANTAKDEFLAMLGHELRNPLAPIVTAVELLKLHGQGETREVASIERQSQHLTRLVDDLLDISRVTRGQLELKCRNLDLADVVAKAIEMAAPLIEQRRHVLEVAVEPDSTVYGDDVRLAQVFANLLTNAAKYTPANGVIRVTSRRLGQHIALDIQDSGRGISPELLPRLFTPFVQASQTSQRAEGGLGLGLALAHSIILSHGGTIAAQSGGHGHGSTFTVTLAEAVPARLERESVAPRSAELRSTVDPAFQVLVVDDNEDAAELLAVLLEKLGHRVVVANDPVRALEAVRVTVPDIAFLDIGLPVMDGYELAAHFRKELGAQCPTLVAVTGYGQQRDRERSREASFALHLVKPVHQAMVLDALKQLAAPISQAGE